jgi:hypothetical protein
VDGKSNGADLKAAQKVNFRDFFVSVCEIKRKSCGFYFTILHPRELTSNASASLHDCLLSHIESEREYVCWNH